MIDSAVKTFGRLDVLINNAGILRDRMLANMTEDEWDAVIKVHLKGTFAPSRHASAYWREESKQVTGPVKARIINVTSTSGIYGNVGQTNYGAATSPTRRSSVLTSGRLDGLINTAGVVRARMLASMTEDEWDAVIKVHLKGTFAPSRHASAYWREESKQVTGP